MNNQDIILSCQGASPDVITTIVNIVMAACALVTLLYTVKTNNDTAKESRKTAELNNKMAELKYRQLIIDANKNFLMLSQKSSKTSNKDLESAIEQLLNAYEVICYLKRDEIPTESFRALYGNEMLEILNLEQIDQKINENKEDYRYVKRAKKILENNPKFM